MVQSNLEIPVVEEPKSSSSRRHGVMLCYPFEEKRLVTWKKPYIIQPKLDGVRCRALITKDDVTLISSEGHTIDHVPHINKYLSKAFTDINIELDGELYVHGMNFQDIISRTSRSKNKHPDSGQIEYHIFDIINNQMQIDRLSALNKLGYFIVDECIRIVSPSVVRDIDEVMTMYHQYLDEGYEGFVIRDAYSGYARKRYTGIMKFKPHQTDTYTIIGSLEEISINGDPKGTLGAFVCTSSEGTIFNVGTGLTAEQRNEYWKVRDTFVGKKLKVKYQSLTQGKGIPRFPVALDII